jgi:hypothetical protein
MKMLPAEPLALETWADPVIAVMPLVAPDAISRPASMVIDPPLPLASVFVVMRPPPDNCSDCAAMSIEPPVP